MAGPYYVDISAPAAWNGKTGLDTTTNAWLGLSGLQKAFDTVVAGETCYVKGSASDLSKFYNVAYDASSGTTLTDGEGVSWGADATAGTGVVRVAVSTAGGSGTVEIEVLTGVAPANDLVITGATSTETITPTATIAIKTIDVDTNAGTYNGGFIKFIGCSDDVDYTVNGDRAIIDGQGTAGVSIITQTLTADLIWYENIEVKNTGAGTYDGFLSASGATGCVYINCCASNCGRSGFYAIGYYSLLFRCVAYSCVYGFVPSSTLAILFGCCARQNSSEGFRLTSEVLIGCISSINTGDGVNYSSGYYAAILNSVIHGNTSDGIHVTQRTDLYPMRIIGNRITYHPDVGDIGLNCNSRIAVYGFNYFDGNDDDIANNTIAQFIPLEGGSSDSNLDSETQDDADYGYVNSAGNNFATDYTDATDPMLRRTAITVPWS